MSNLAPDDSWAAAVRAAFPDETLITRIHAAVRGDEGDLAQLFADMSRCVLALKEQSHSQDGQPNTKKRKLENGAEINSDDRASMRVQPRPLRPFFECTDVSVQVPARKKMKVELATDAAHPGASLIALHNPATSDIEYSLPASRVDQAFCLPMPEKQARQMNFVLFPKPGAVDAVGRPAEQILFVMNETHPSAVVAHKDTFAEGDTYITITQRALEQWLGPYGRRVITPNAAEFASNIPQSHRKGEKAYHVKAHRGSKEGYLFFLENGIVFGFKKPLAFFPFSSIESISYTSVLQRTFNLVIAAREGDSTEVKEVEFSMLDQGDFAGINAYVKRHGLNDVSMAAQRRAKAYNVNREKKEEVNDAANGGVEEDGQTELQKAEQQLQDEEDELEEDYEVSGGESEGEGEDSEEEEEAYDDEEVEEVEGGYEDEEGNE